MHHAVQQLRSGSSRVAIAAGANLILSPRNTDLSVRAHTLLTCSSTFHRRKQIEHALTNRKVTDVG